MGFSQSRDISISSITLAEYRSARAEIDRNNSIV